MALVGLQFNATNAESTDTNEEVHKEEVVLGFRPEKPDAWIDKTDEHAERAMKIQKEYQERREEERKRKEEEKRQRKEAERKAEEARIAQAKKEEAEREAQRQAELKAQEKEKQQSQSSSQQAPAPKQQAQKAPVKKQRTDGFNFHGYHFPTAVFDGGGGAPVPKETPYVYQWASKPSHYLVEQVSPAGRVIQQLGMGDTVVLHGTTYVVTHIKRKVPNDNNAMNVLNSVAADMTIQTCEYTKGPNGASDLSLWYLKAQ